MGTDKAGSKHHNSKNLAPGALPQCPICSGSFSFFTSFHDVLFEQFKNDVDIYSCVSCGLLKVIPEPTPDEIKSFYPEDYYSHQEPELNEESESFASKFYVNLQEAILDRHYKKKSPAGFLLRMVSWFFKNSLLCVPSEKPKGGGRFLDIGSGSGYWVEKLSKYDWSCKGIDIIGKESKNNIIGDFLKVPFEQKFEYIRIHGVIEHVIDPCKYIEKISELLEKNGEFHISTPNSNCLSFKLFKKYWIGLEVPRHIQVFNDQNLARLLKKHELEVIKVSSELSAGGFISCMHVYLKDKFGIASPHPNLWLFLIAIFLPLDFLVKWLNQSINMGEFNCEVQQLVKSSF